MPNSYKKSAAKAHAALPANVQPTKQANTSQNVNPKELNQADYIKFLIQQLNEQNQEIELLKAQQRELRKKERSESKSKNLSLEELAIEYSPEPILSIPHRMLRELFEKNLLLCETGSPDYVYTYINLTQGLNFIWNAFTFKLIAIDRDAYYSMSQFKDLQTFLGYIIIDGLEKPISDQYFHTLAEDAELMKGNLKELVNYLHKDYLNISKALMQCDYDLLGECVESLRYLDKMYSFYQECNTYLLTHKK